MALVFHRGLAIPLWAIAFFAVALAAPPRAMPPVTVLLAIAVLALTMMAMVQWRRWSRPLVEVLAVPSRDRGHVGITMTVMNPGTSNRIVDHATGAPTRKAGDALDLVRMDDDGGWQMAREPAVPVVPIPGAREPGMLTKSETSAASGQIVDGPSPMDATTLAERQREGGGAPSQRRPAHKRSPWDLGQLLHRFFVTTRTLFPWRFRTNHV